MINNTQPILSPAITCGTCNHYTPTDSIGRDVERGKCGSDRVTTEVVPYSFNLLCVGIAWEPRPEVLKKQRTVEDLEREITHLETENRTQRETIADMRACIEALTRKLNVSFDRIKEFEDHIGVHIAVREL